MPAQATETDTILLGGQVVMRIRARADGNSPSDRADIIRSRLASILSGMDVAASTIAIRQEGPKQDATIYLGDQLVIRVDSTLTEANGMEDPLDLARIWAGNLRKTLPQGSARENGNSPRVRVAGQ